MCYSNCVGFEGINCEIVKADCVGGSCSEEQICPDGSRRNTSCSAGAGKSLPDPCSSNPCNNGTCQSHGESYTCLCQEGITGLNCETDINECNENRTICNNGICINTIGEFSTSIYL